MQLLMVNTNDSLVWTKKQVCIRKIDCPCTQLAALVVCMSGNVIICMPPTVGQLCRCGRHSGQKLCGSTGTSTQTHTLANAKKEWNKKRESESPNVTLTSGNSRCDWCDWCNQSRPTDRSMHLLSGRQETWPKRHVGPLQAQTGNCFTKQSKTKQKTPASKFSTHCNCESINYWLRD